MNDAADRNPYPGLRPFRADEAHLFFGRDDEVDAMVDRLGSQRLLAVLGGSGSGKSSLVNCGLRPALHRGLLAAAGTAWRVAVCRPGSDPIGSLARALAQPRVLFDGERDGIGGGGGDDTPGRDTIVEATLRMSRLGLVDVVEQARLPAGVNVLVVVDQFEELFRYRRLRDPRSADDATAFVGLLLQARAQTALPIRVVLTMRSDFLGECSAIDGLAQAINDGQYLVPRMTRDERRAAIAGPARVAGSSIAPVLLTRLVNDVGDDPDQLSILQHALNRTWAHWAAVDGSGPVALAHYEDASVGTMANALDRHAEQAWSSLPDDDARDLARRLFRAITDRATDPRGIRRPARLATLVEVTRSDPDALRAVIEVFRAPDRSFLMPPLPEPLADDTVVDIAHESLMRVWQRLQSWADDEARSAQQLRRLADAAALEQGGRGGLWRDPELHFALEWEGREQPNAAWAAMYGVDLAPALRFLRASEAARDAERAAERRRLMRRRIAAGALVATLAVVGIVFGALWQRSERLLVITEARKMVLESRAMLDGDVATPIDVALLLAAGAFRLDAGNEAHAGLQSLLDHTPRLQRVQALPGPLIAIAPDASVVVTVHGDTLQIVDARSGLALVEPLRGHVAAVNAVGFSPDGRTIASASDDGTVRLWDVATGAARGEPLRGHADRVWSVAFSSDGRWLASGDETGVMRVWDAASGAAIGGVRGHALRIFALAFGPDGDTLASAGDDGMVSLWQLPTLAPRRQWRAALGVVSTLAFSPDGRRLASAGGDRVVRLWDVASGSAVGEPMSGHDGRIWSVAFSPDGRQLASAGEDHAVRLWPVGDATPVGAPVLLGHKGRVWRVAYTVDGSGVVSGGNDRRLLRWRSDDLTREATLTAAGPSVRSVATSRDGRLIATAGDDGAVRLWETTTRAPHGAPLVGHAGSVAAVVFSPDGQLIASSGEDGSIRLWTADGAARGAPLVEADAGPVWSIVFSPDGRRLASGHADGGIRLWDVADGRRQREALRGHAGPVWSVAWSPDGSRLASGGEDATVRLWDADSGAAIGQPSIGHRQRVWGVAFSPDGRELASAGEDGSLRRWDPASGAPIGAPSVGHLVAATAVAYSPDGTVLATTSDDATVRYWDARDGAPRGAPLTGHDGAVVSVAFGADGRTLVTAAVDGGVRLWDTPVVWIDRVCSRLTRNLGQREWDRLVGAVAYRTQCPALPRPGVRDGDAVDAVDAGTR